MINKYPGKAEDGSTVPRGTLDEMAQMLDTICDELSAVKRLRYRYQRAMFICCSSEEMTEDPTLIVVRCAGMIRYMVPELFVWFRGICYAGKEKAACEVIHARVLLTNQDAARVPAKVLLLVTRDEWVRALSPTLRIDAGTITWMEEPV